MRLVCLSDTHGRHHELKVPDGDLLLHAGDFSGRGLSAEISDFNAWLGSLPHRHKLVIAGNHDFLFETDPTLARGLLNQADYLEDSGIELMGLTFWGSPVSPRFFDWAFNRSRGPEIQHHWSLIPSGIDILITHTPPHGICDQIWIGRHVGCEALRDELISRIRPRLLICGHIHEGAGLGNLDGIPVLNAASLDRRYQPVQPLWVVDIDPVSKQILSLTAHDPAAPAPADSQPPG
ncbi:MAG: metallophosphoesterase [Candidatus Melainabacteria bacterium HGW-Melainabacteria-1]|nr:MAG: metallophosphoesterase [Candidatus Melainabacteria bacterium HGW-Melainabacteria-1]